MKIYVSSTVNLIVHAINCILCSLIFKEIPRNEAPIALITKIDVELSPRGKVKLKHEVQNV
jgi:hypothetical protein